MATIQKYEDLFVWQKARELVKFVYEISKSRNFEMDRGLQDQIRRASVSVMSNIAEGFDRGTKQEFINYLFIAKGSCGEVKTQLYIAYDVGYIDISKFQYGLALCDGTSRLLQSFISKLKTGGRAGLQYKKEEKKDTWIQDHMAEEGYIMTERGFKKREEAESLGLKQIKVPNM